MEFDDARAKAVDLVILPESIAGTKCKNCHSYDDGYCEHPKVKMHVKPHWCCYYWNRPDAPVATEKDLDMVVSRHSIEESISRFMKLTEDISDQDLDEVFKEVKSLTVSRFSDCGHDKDGLFSEGNTCASLRGKREEVDPSHSGKHLGWAERKKREAEIISSRGAVVGENEEYYDKKNPERKLSREESYEITKAVHKDRKERYGEKKPLFEEHQKREHEDQTNQDIIKKEREAREEGRAESRHVPKMLENLKKEKAEGLARHAFDNYKTMTYEDINKHLEHLAHLPTEDLKKVYHKLIGSNVPYYESTKGKIVASLRDRLHRLKLTHTRNQFKSSKHVSRFEDCGHDDDGDFSKGNTCAEGRKYDPVTDPRPAHHDEYKLESLRQSHKKKIESGEVDKSAARFPEGSKSQREFLGKFSDKQLNSIYNAFLKLDKRGDLDEHLEYYVDQYSGKRKLMEKISLAYNNYVESRGIREHSGGESAEVYNLSEGEEMLRREADSIMNHALRAKNG